MHQHQQDYDRLNIISQRVSGLLENLPADWQQIYDLAQEAEVSVRNTKLTAHLTLSLFAQ